MKRDTKGTYEYTLDVFITLIVVIRSWEFPCTQQIVYTMCIFYTNYITINYFVRKEHKQLISYSQLKGEDER